LNFSTFFAVDLSFIIIFIFLTLTATFSTPLTSFLAHILLVVR
jgi:hypothetical protein